MSCDVPMLPGDEKHSAALSPAKGRLVNKRPFTAVPATRSSASSLKMKQNLIIAALLLGFVCGPLALFVSSREAGKPAPAAAQLPTAAIGFAEVVAQDFLNARRSAMPSADGVSTDFSRPTGAAPVAAFPYQSLSFERVAYDDVEGRTIYQVQFRLTRALAEGEEKGGTLQASYLLTVPVATDNVGRLYLAARPSFSADVLAADNTHPGASVAESARFAPSEGVRTAAAEWAAAYFSGDSSKLTRYVRVGGSSPEGVYPAISGFSCAAAPENPTQGCVDARFATSHRLNSQGYGWVRASVVLGYGSANEFTTRIEFDLLVANYNLPNGQLVVAWGPAGSGPELNPYQNIIPTTAQGAP
jgi:hypothetical protein